MLEKKELMELDDTTLDAGYRSCRQLVKRNLKSHLWPVSNLAGESKKGTDAILAHLLTTVDLLDLESFNGLSLDVWHEIRDGVSDAFLDKYSSAELAALVDTCRRFDVPKQYIFDPLRGADLWIRSRKFETYSELEAFCSYVGGSFIAALVPVLGFVKPDYELPAIACGKAIMLTQIVANVVNDMKSNRNFIAKEDLESCDVDVSRLKMRQATQSFRYLVRLYCKRLEALYVEGGKLVNHLDYDGKRSLTSLLATYWKILTKMQLDPDLVLSPDGVLTMTERFGLRSKHLLGLNTKLKIIPADSHH